MAIDKIFDGAVDGIADNLFNSVSNSVSEIKAMQQRKAAENVQLVVQALKKIDADIREKYDVVTETFDKRISNIKDGQDGKDGKNGRDGLNGKDGRDGKDGRNGRDGATGPRGFDGPKGLDGKDGKDGEDGVSVVSAYIDFDGSLIISLSSGELINVGEVVSPDIAEKIKVITNGGGTSQVVLDTLASLQNQINNIVSGLSYKGTWNATTNTPTLTSSTGTNGFYYVVSVSGSTNLDGITDWQVGDWAIYNGTVWQKIDQTNLVTSVAGRTGAVTLSNTDISGLGTMSTQNSSSVSISGGTVSGITDLAIADGGTGQSTAAAAITALTGTQTNGYYLRSNGANAVLAAIVAGDVPTLNQNTTGTAGNVTGTVGVGNGGTNLTSLTTKGVLYASSTTQVATGTGLQFDGTNLGVGVAPSAWGSIHRAIEFGAAGSLAYFVNGSVKKTSLSTNSYNATNTGARPYYKENGLATEYYQNAGEHFWSTAPSGVAGSTTAIVSGRTYTNLTAGNQPDFGAANGFVGTIWGATSSGTLTTGTVVQNIDFVESMRIDTSGNVGIGTSPGSKLEVKGTLRLAGSTSGYVGLAPAAAAGSTTYTLPSADGTVGQALVTNGSGVLSFTDFTSGASGSSTQVQYNNGGSFAGSANLTFNGTTLTANALTTTSTVTINGGTANGVGYLNSSKVFTTGSALVFDGTNLLVGTTTSTYNNSGRSCIELNGSADSLIAFKSGGTSSGYLYGGSATLSLYATGASSVLTLGTNATERARIDINGNLGLGVTPSAWPSSVRAIETQTGAFYSYVSGTTSNFYMLTNAYFNGTNNIYKASNFATQYLQSAGQHIWYNAPSGVANSTSITSGRAYVVFALGSSTLGQWQAFFSGLSALPTVGQNITATATGTLLGGGTVSQAITFTQAMTLTADGNLQLGITGATSTRRLIVYGSLGSAASTSLALQNSTSGINSTDGFTMELDGVNGYLYNYENGPVIFGTNNTERLRIDSSGNVGIGTASPISKFAVSNGTTRVEIAPSSTSVTFQALNDARTTTSELLSAGSILTYWTGAAGSQAERMRLDGAGNLGLGVTPSAWSSYYKPLQAGTNGAFAGGNDDSVFTSNAFYDGNWKYITSSVAATRLRQTGGTFTFSTAPSSGVGGANTAITWTQAMTLDASGRLLVGTTASAYTSSGRQNLAVNGSSQAAYEFQVGGTGVGYLIGTSANVEFGATGYINFVTNGVDRARIDTSGNLGLGVSPNTGWAIGKVLQLTAVTGPFLFGAAGQTILGTNAYYDTSWKYGGAGYATYYQQANGSHNWHIAASGSANAPITFIQEMTLDASGRLGIGTTSPAQRLDVSSASSSDTDLKYNMVVRSTDAYTTTPQAGIAFSVAFNTTQNLPLCGIYGGKENATLNDFASKISFATRANGGNITERARIDSSGNLLVGGTTALQRITSTKNISANNAADSGIAILRSGTTYGSNLYHTYSTTTNTEAFGLTVNDNTTLTDAQYTKYLVGSNGAHIWYGATTATERARIDSSGNFLVGTTTLRGRITVESNSQTIAIPIVTNDTRTGSTSSASIRFDRSGTTVGSITTTDVATAYNTSSDQRLKENIQDADFASTLIDALQVRKFDWKADGSHQRYGFVAQELVTVAPEAVHQPEDSEEMMAVDYSKLVPMLVKEIQSLRKRLADAGL